MILDFLANSSAAAAKTLLWALGVAALLARPLQLLLFSLLLFLEELEREGLGLLVRAVLPATGAFATGEGFAVVATLATEETLAALVAAELFWESLFLPDFVVLFRADGFGVAFEGVFFGVFVAGVSVVDDFLFVFGVSEGDFAAAAARELFLRAAADDFLRGVRRGVGGGGVPGLIVLMDPSRQRSTHCPRQNSSVGSTVRPLRVCRTAIPIACTVADSPASAVAAISSVTSFFLCLEGEIEELFCIRNQ